MTLKSLIASDVSRVLLNTNDFAELISLEGVTDPITAVVVLEASDGRQEYRHGDRVQHRGEIHVAESVGQTLSEKQAVTIKGDRFIISGIGKPHGGIIVCHVVRSEANRVNPSQLDPGM